MILQIAKQIAFRDEESEACETFHLSEHKNIEKQQKEN